MKSTDKFYDLDMEDIHKLQSRILDTLNECSEKHHLTVEDLYALARILAYRLESGDDNGMYEHVVDFLWMSFHIEINHKMLLLDLLEKTN